MCLTETGLVASSCNEKGRYVGCALFKDRGLVIRRGLTGNTGVCPESHTTERRVAAKGKPRNRRVRDWRIIQRGTRAKHGDVGESGVSPGSVWFLCAISGAGSESKEGGGYLREVGERRRRSAKHFVEARVSKMDPRGGGDLRDPALGLGCHDLTESST